MTDIDLDTKIKKKFRLFEGLRSEEEDQKIFERVYELLFDEVVMFLEEKLEEKDKISLIKELEASALPSGDKQAQQDSGNFKNAEAILIKYLSKIENYRFKLDKRLDYFLNNLVYQAIKNKN